MFYGPVVRHALEVASVVGTITFVINQLGAVLSGRVTALVVLKVALTYLVPYVVATLSALQVYWLRQTLATSSQDPPPPQGEPSGAGRAGRNP